MQSSLLEAAASKTEMNRHTFCVRLTSPSMEPWCYAGDLLWVDLSQSPKDGDFVFVEHTYSDSSEVLAHVRRMIRQTESELVLQSLCPDKEFRLSRERIVRMGKVLSITEMLTS